MKTIASFRYAADAVPAGARRPRRILLTALAEIEIAEISASAVQREAFVMETSEYYDGGSLIKSYDLWQGRLWRAMTNTWLEQEGLLSFDDYKARIREDGGEESPGDPLPESLVKSHAVDADGPLQCAEDFAGRILWDNKGDTARRLAICAERLCSIDGVMHRAIPEPTWLLSTASGGQDQIRLVESASPDTMDYPRFRADRRDDALEWAGRTGRKPVARGRVLWCAPGALRRDDALCTLAAGVAHLAGDRAASFLPYLPPEIMQPWRRLLDARTAQADPCDGRFEFRGDAAGTLADLRTVRDAIARAVLPTDLTNRRDDILSAYETTFARIEFERGRTPSQKTDATEDAALDAIASPAA